MLHKIVISKRAYNQFQSICDYLVDEFGERVADNFPDFVDASPKMPHKFL